MISGGASVGEKDFTRPLLEWLGFEIVFSQVNVRPGKPLIFGVNGSRVAFGLPGNPLSHFVCFHFAVATALARLAGEPAPKFLRGKLAGKIGRSAVSARNALAGAAGIFGWQNHSASAGVGEFRRRDLFRGGERADARAGESRFARRGRGGGFFTDGGMLGA